MTRLARWTLLGLLAAPCAALAQPVGSAVSPIGGDSTQNSFGGTGTGGTSGSLGGTNELANNPAFRAPQITGLSSAVAPPVGVLNQSNILGGYYANVYYQGRAGATTLTQPGGFGTELYQGGGQGGAGISTNSNAFSNAAGGSIGSSSGFGGNTGSNRGGGNLASRGGNNAFGNGGNNRQNFGGQNQVGGVIVPLTVPITYSAKLMFAAPPVSATAVVGDVRQMLDRAGPITNPGGIDVFTDGQVVVLRGTVGSVMEAQTAEGMVRLTPGVRQVKNELKVVTASAPGMPTP